jgi:hypothetical protein
MKILVFGSRKWVNQGAVERELAKLPPETVIVHGAAAGADNIGGYVAKRLKFEVRPYPADWMTHGKAAGPQRNQRMINEEHPDSDGMFFDLALCFHEDPGLGKGSHDMHKRLLNLDPPIEIRIFDR